MDTLLKWSQGVDLKLSASTGNWEHVFFAERINYSCSFVEIETPQDVREAVLKEGSNEYTLYTDCMYYRAKTENEYTWGYVPKPERIRIGFAGAELSELLSRVVKWFEDHTDLEQPAIAIPYSGDNNTKLPITIGTKRLPHWKEGKDE